MKDNAIKVLSDMSWVGLELKILKLLNMDSSKLNWFDLC